MFCQPLRSIGCGCALGFAFTALFLRLSALALGLPVRLIVPKLSRPSQPNS